MRKINEIFYSIQGEGFHAGMPCVFIRFAGCNLRCPFCDTRHEEGTEMDDERIWAEAGKYPATHVVLTGGEPGLQVDEAFVEGLHRMGKSVHVETNGTCPLPANIDWVTCSPKEGSRLRIGRIDELKVVYTGQDLEPYEKMPAAVHCLQPCSCRNTEEVIAYVKAHPLWRLSLQTHKWVGIR